MQCEPWNQEQRTEAMKRFPYGVIIESFYPEGDFAHRWCWQQFGPMDCKVCAEHYSDYPGCPKVLAIETYKIKKTYEKDGVVHEYDFHTRDPGEHGHVGTWTTVWLGKTGYDYGFTQYCFSTLEQQNKFVEAVPTFTWENIKDED